ncbi:cytochrome P450 [Herbidospora cretacea]|uniref:cytochrome P450 n=1 Tax=Herbidospora cretacea TaxID=28444 RepID=UPI0007C77F68|nr:cytochrome P450 [Herbidospora cretacea]
MTVLSDSELSSHLKKSKAALWSVGALGDPYALVLRGLDDPYPVYEKIRAYGPMSRSRLGTWVTADHGLAHELSRDRRFGVRFKDGRRVAPSVPQFDNSFVGMDAPDHNRLRRIAAPAFLPRVVEQYRAEVEKLCHDLIDQIDTSGEFDLMETFARQVPVNVIASLFGITDENRAQFQRFCKGLTHTLDGNLTLAAARDLSESIEGMNELVGELIEERSARPAGDVISRIQKALDGDKLTTAEAVTICTMLSLGGSETTVNMIGSGILALLDTPGQWDLLKNDPGLSAATVEESLRFDTPVQIQVRVAHEEVEVAGVPLAVDDVVAIINAAANRDPAVYTDPNTFDITRVNPADHLAFSGGAHYCAGAPLARLEGDVAFRALAERLPGLRRAGEVKRRKSGVIRGLLEFPVKVG